MFWVARTGVYLYGQSNPKRIKGIRDTKPSIYFTIPYKKAEDELHDELLFNLNLTIEKLLISHPVYIVHPTPEMRKNIPMTLAKNILLENGNYDLSLDYSLYFLRNERVRDLINQVAIINDIEALDPIPYLCNNGRCIAELQGRPIYYDGDHMSEYGNKLLTPLFKLAIDKLK